MVIGLGNCVLGRIFGTGEREAERNVTGDCVLRADCVSRIG